MRLSETEMSWREFSDLLGCLSADTALGRIVAIRSEEDADVLKNFTKVQHEIRNNWRNRNIDEEEAYRQSMSNMLAMALA